MKILNKLRLINWHLFFNDTVEIKPITFLTGSNGTGKSTIIDAMQVLLLADTSGRNFNKAANERTGRTLRGYLRCELGETSQGQVMTLRPGRFSSYIAMQFYDDSKDSTFSLGIVFDCYEDDKEEHRFFYLNDKFPENNFSNSSNSDNKSLIRPMSYKELSNFFQANYKTEDYKFFDTNTAYKAFLKEILGDLPDKFFSLFKNAVSFTPFTNISSFITEFVCDLPHKVDITSMQTNIEQYKLLEIEAKKIQTKIDSLKAIQEAYNNYQNIKSNLGLADYVVDRANFESAKRDLESYKKRLDENNLRIIEISKLLAEKDEQIAELKSESESYLAKKVGSQGYSLASSISSKKNVVLEKIATLQDNYASLALTLKSYIRQYSEALNAINVRLNNFDESILTDREADELEKFKNDAIEFTNTYTSLLEQIERKDIDVNLLNEFQTEMSSLHSSSLRFVHILEDTIADLNDSIGAINSQLFAITSGQKPYSNQLLQVKAVFEDELRQKYPDARIDFFCDLCDIKTKRWVKSIEAYINTQKFNFFINNEDYYVDGAKILDRVVRQYDLYGLSLVDTQRLIARNFKAEENSVAEEIVTSNKGARAYANFLLGRVQKCETFQEARESGNGLLPNLTGYRNFASFSLKERTPFFGTKISEESAFEKQDDLNEFNRKLDIYNDLNSYFKAIATLEVISSSEIKTFVSDLSSLQQIDTFNQEIERLDNQLEEGDLGEVNSYDNKIKSIESDIKALEEEKNKLLIEQGGLENTNKTLKDDLIPTKSAYVTIAGDKLLKYDPSLVEEKYGPFFEKAIESMSLTKITEQARITYVQTQNRMKISKDKLIDLRSKYTVTYHLSYDTTKEDSNEDFDNELNNLTTVLLPSYLQQIEVAHKKAIKEFKDDFIYKLRNSFKIIETQIDELNLALKDVKFGRDSYRFLVEPNRDYIEYYNMITDDLLLNVGDAEDVYLEKYGAVLNNLFNMISESTTSSIDQREQIIANVEKFTDYRTYLVFDLLVKRGNSDTESSLARTFKRQSGGETQTPFYIAILASFAQLYRTNDEHSDTIRLVIFDEAFSKMDGSRIKEAVSLLRSFGLQVILSTPTEKVVDLVNEVDLTLVVMHDVKHNRSRIDRYQDKKKLDNNTIAKANLEINV